MVGLYRDIGVIRLVLGPLCRVSVISSGILGPGVTDVGVDTWIMDSSDTETTVFEFT